MFLTTSLIRCLHHPLCSSLQGRVISEAMSMLLGGERCPTAICTGVVDPLREAVPFLLTLGVAKFVMMMAFALAFLQDMSTMGDTTPGLLRMTGWIAHASFGCVIALESLHVLYDFVAHLSRHQVARC